MTKRMLIDATHKEEIRVAITDGNKLVEYDYESQNRKPLKGSIFLAKVTRVEPSLQAAFVSFGGNRHGFLPFSEIHPDYFRIPVADREALIAEQEALLQQHDDEVDLDDEDNDIESENEDTDEAIIIDIKSSDNEENIEENNSSISEIEESEKKEVKEDEEDKKEAEGEKELEKVSKPKSKTRKSTKIPKEKDNPKLEDIKSEDIANDSAIEKEDLKEGIKNTNKEESEKDNENADADNEKEDSEDKKNTRRRSNYRGRGRGSKRSQYRNRNVEIVGGEEMDEDQRFRFNLRRKYKIQEVIKRGQIMLVQANKEERGNKGAAVGSYLSLPGRYCVLMPNSPRGGGVSRKIANHKDRARMREIVKELEVPKGMSVIVRTAGVGRTKEEIKRDLDYLMRLWDNIRELTLQSTAPALVYEEADLIKRSVRDLYTNDIETIYVAGEKGYNTARDFMEMIIPSHVNKVKLYDSKKLPLFNRYQIESQINEIGQVEVRLKSGGYLVINPTEALVSVDVNSGKATKGRHIEETALKTNLEAADEVARQLRLRDLGGLVVIDFIDMENRGHNAKVERRMKEALSADRARIQVGRISSFGLMELSRQRLSPSLTEAQFEQCNNCSGVGLIRTAEAMSILVLRAIEDEGIRARAAQIIVQVNSKVALYILNYKRKKMAQIEERYNLEVLIRVDDEIPASEYKLEVSKPAEKSDNKDIEDNNIDISAEKTTEEETQDENNRSRRRGRRGGRNRNNKQDNAEKNGNIDKSQPEDIDGNILETPSSKEADGNKLDKPKRKTRARKEKEDKKEVKKENKPSSEKPADVANDDNIDQENPTKKPARKKADPKNKDKKAKDDKDKEDVKSAKDNKPSAASMYETVNKPPKQKKKGWWNRL